MSGFVTELVHEWHELGNAVTVDALIDGGLRVKVETDHGRGVIELDARASEALLEALDRWADANQVGAWWQQIADLTAERDRLLELGRELREAIKGDANQDAVAILERMRLDS